MEYLEKFYKYAPYVGLGLSTLSALKAPEYLRSTAGWLSGETYTGDYGKRFQYENTNDSMYTDRGVGGAFGGFESTARDYLTNQGYSWSGNLAGETINLVGEIMSAPIELGFRARDEVQGFLGANPRLNKIRQAIGEGIGIYDAQRGQGGKPKSKGERYERERIKHKEMGIGSPAAMRRLADARRIQTQQSKGYGGVYDPKVAQLLQYAMHELSPSISEKIQSRKTFGLFDTGSQRIGRGKGIG